MTEAKETFAFQQLDAYVAAKEFARLVQNARISDKELRDPRHPGGQEHLLPPL